MTSAFEKLTKILTLEKEQGYRNKAVIGGLEKFASFWREGARQEAEDLERAHLVEEIVALLQSYPTLEDRRSREGVVEDILTRLGQRPRRVKEEPLEKEEAVKPKEAQPRERQGLDSPVTAFVGIGPSHAERFKRLGVETIRDLLYLFPRRYNDFSSLKTINQLEYGEEVTIIGNIWETKARETRKGGIIVTSIISDGTGTIQATWFNQPYLVKRLPPGRQIVLSGKVDEYLGRLVFQSPEWEPLEKELVHTARLVPVYPLTKGLSARWLRRLMKKTVDYWSKRLPDHLPARLCERANLMDLETAIGQIHFPENEESLNRARRRLCFDEFFLIQLGVQRQRHLWRSKPGRALVINEELLGSFLQSLPFTLTSAQQRALREIVNDLRQPYPMSRLLQGDVGSGKTVVAAAAMLLTVANGCQAVMMAPTEILAEQHYKTIADLLANIQYPISNLKPFDLAQGKPPTSIRLLIGSLTSLEKQQIHQEAAAGVVDILIGTHALIQEGVEFRDLGLAVIDEQHRFGVAQRAALRQKGITEAGPSPHVGGKEGGAVCPHVLVMSATPIPRTLALTIYGDLDIAVVDELPPGRREIKTRWLLPRERERAYGFLRGQIEQGHQAFIICPLVEESEKIEAKAAVEEYERLQRVIFPDLKLGLLHGRLKGEEKEAVMAAFKRGEFHILVSTSVVELGIDVPNATVMLVEGANRFGLAQLHQFRGRVGRSEYQSYCLLLSDSPTPEAQERLRAIETTQDGFALAEKDLELRGPGEFFGTRQSGLPELKLAGLGDVRILEQARNEAQALSREDPDLTKPEHRLLARKLAEFWRGESDLS
ncbi:MAG: ATP-dependent DNA helicase RecG [Chloroflexi bacterium]|nr:ATP-dependent DNA helicase RecG [Chloroflexota bacterium]